MALKACSRSDLRECSAQKEAKDVISERDRISELPDEILVIILSSLPTRNSVGASTLSKRWRNVWTSVPVIEIDYWSLWNEYNTYHMMKSGSICVLFDYWLKNFVDRLFLNYEICFVRKLLLCSDSTDYGLSNLIKVDNLEELYLKFKGDQIVELPSSTFTRKNLVILKLSGSHIELNSPPSVCLPSLKRLHLETVHIFDFDSSVKKILTGCPVLEKLNIERCTRDKMKKTTLHIQSSSLKSLTFYSAGYTYRDCQLKMVIDATNLERLVLMVDRDDKVSVTSSLTSLVSLDLSFRKNVYKFKVFKLLMKMSYTKYLYLSAEVLEFLQHRPLDYLPMLTNLTHCEVDIFLCSLPILSCLLESSPNLISFVCNKKLQGGCYEPRGQFRRPKCMMLYLEEIKLFTLEGGDEYPMEVVSYFLENAPALKKMFITFKCPKPELVLSDLHGKVLKLPKVSTACEIYVRNK